VSLWSTAIARHQQQRFSATFPDLDLDEDDTLYPFLREGERSSLDDALRKTHFDGLELIPSEPSPV